MNGQYCGQLRELLLRRCFCKFVKVSLLLGLLIESAIDQRNAGYLLAADLSTKASDVASTLGEAANSAIHSSPATYKKSLIGGFFSRWIDLQTFTLGLEYRAVYNSLGIQAYNQMRLKDSIKGRFKLDSKGNYSVGALLSTGPSFVTSWNSTGVGTGQTIFNHYIKQLYFSVKLLSGFEVQYGGLEIIRGESTDITSYDTNGYIVGQRISLRKSKKLFFDEISVTYAYFGDYLIPNAFRRLHHLGQSNFHQFLVTKTLRKRLSVSGDYTFQDGTETLRQAFNLKAAELKLVDSIRFENYQRVDVKSAYGLAVTAEKSINKRLSLGGGFAVIDKNFDVWNAARIVKGKRLIGQVNYNLSPEFWLTILYTNAFKNDFVVPNNRYLEVILNYSVLKGLQRKGFLN